MKFSNYWIFWSIIQNYKQILFVHRAQRIGQFWDFFLFSGIPLGLFFRFKELISKLTSNLAYKYNIMLEKKLSSIAQLPNYAEVM